MNTRKLIKLTAYICVLFVFNPFLFAQQKEAEEKQKFSFKAISFSRIPGLEEIYFGEDKDMLRLPSRNFSREMKYEGTIPTIFYGKKVNVASFLVSEKDTIEIKDKSKEYLPRIDF